MSFKITAIDCTEKEDAIPMSSRFWQNEPPTLFEIFNICTTNNLDMLKDWFPDALR